jgi:hypothetical protein
VVVGGFRLPIKGMADNPTWKPFNPTGGEISKGTLQNQKCSGTCFWSIKTKVQLQYSNLKKKIPASYNL